MPDYVYITGQGADPGAGSILTDPIFGKIPTLGACMPNLRRMVEPGDWLYVVSGMRPEVQQYVIGGLQVGEKITALEAYERMIPNRLRIEGGEIRGNVPVDADGNKHPLDSHAVDGFERRARNFIVGRSQIVIDTPDAVDIARRETLPKLQELIGKRGNRPIDVMGRTSKLDDNQSKKMRDWLRSIKERA